MCSSITLGLLGEEGQAGRPPPSLPSPALNPAKLVEFHVNVKYVDAER